MFSKGSNWVKKINLHSQVWENEDNRKMAINILLGIGTNLLLYSNSIGDINCMRAFLPADAISSLENYDGTLDMLGAMLTRGVGTKRRDLGEGNTRDLLKFYSKRLSCSCLKNMYSEARKNMPKMGKCSFCDGVKERRLLSVCSRCRINQYCSRECQVSDWPVHKRGCDACVRIHGLQCKN